jgi:chromosome segregation and condensation protein ScpB
MRKRHVPTDQLTLRERATLLALMAEARELTNAELREIAGFTLDGRPRRRLNEQKLVTSRKLGRSFTHELTDDGWSVVKS